MGCGERVVVVDGETFAVHVRVDGTHDFRWSSGLNADYGFSSAYAPGFPPDEETIERDLRTFLAMIDPQAGYIAD